MNSTSSFPVFFRPQILISNRGIPKEQVYFCAAPVGIALCGLVLSQFLAQFCPSNQRRFPSVRLHFGDAPNCGLCTLVLKYFHSYIDFLQ